MIFTYETIYDFFHTVILSPNFKKIPIGLEFCKGGRFVVENENVLAILQLLMLGGNVAFSSLLLCLDEILEILWNFEECVKAICLELRVHAWRQTVWKN